MLKRISVAIIVLFLTSCSSFYKWSHLPKDRSEIRDIQVLSHGWHTGLVIKKEDLLECRSFPHEDFVKNNNTDDIKYYEIGWGDKGFYQAKTITTSLSLQAMLWPTDSVLHIVALAEDGRKSFPYSECVDVQISAKGLEELSAYIAASFAKNKERELNRTREGIYGNSYFYEARGSYYISNTCNTWVAKALDKAGLPLRTFLALSSGGVIEQSKEAVESFAEIHKL